MPCWPRPSMVPGSRLPGRVAAVNGSAAEAHLLGSLLGACEALLVMCTVHCSYWAGLGLASWRLPCWQSRLIGREVAIARSRCSPVIWQRSPTDQAAGQAPQAPPQRERHGRALPAAPGWPAPTSWHAHAEQQRAAAPCGKTSTRRRICGRRWARRRRRLPSGGAGAPARVSADVQEPVGMQAQPAAATAAAACCISKPAAVVSPPCRSASGGG